MLLSQHINTILYHFTLSNLQINIVKVCAELKVHWTEVKASVPNKIVHDCKIQILLAMGRVALV